MYYIMDTMDKKQWTIVFGKKGGINPENQYMSVTLYNLKSCSNVKKSSILKSLSSVLFLLVSSKCPTPSSISLPFFSTALNL